MRYVCTYMRYMCTYMRICVHVDSGASLATLALPHLAVLCSAIVYQRYLRRAADPCLSALAPHHEAIAGAVMLGGGTANGRSGGHLSSIVDNSNSRTGGSVVLASGTSFTDGAVSLFAGAGTPGLGGAVSITIAGLLRQVSPIRVTVNPRVNLERENVELQYSAYKLQALTIVQCSIKVGSGTH